MRLTIGMAHYDDFDGAYFTIQNIRKEMVFTGNIDLLNKIEFVVVDNNPESAHGLALEKFLKNNLPSTGDIRLIKMPGKSGTSITRNKIIDVASGDFVLVMDCHVMLCPTVPIIKKLFQFMEKNPDTKDIYSGPLVSDDMSAIHTHFNLNWSCGMWGQWGSTFACTCGQTFSGIKKDGNLKYMALVNQNTIKRCESCGKELPKIEANMWKRKIKELGYKELGWENNSQFSIPAQGLGLFFVKRDKWLRFNDHCRGFGGEEGYIHEKYRQNGRNAVCLSFLKWLHRFFRPEGVKYSLTDQDKLRNYILEFTELGLDIAPVIEHFSEIGVPSTSVDMFKKEAQEIYNRA